MQWLIFRTRIESIFIELGSVLPTNISKWSQSKSILSDFLHLKYKICLLNLIVYVFLASMFRITLLCMFDGDHTTSFLHSHSDDESQNIIRKFDIKKTYTIKSKNKNLYTIEIANTKVISMLLVVDMVDIARIATG